MVRLVSWEYPTTSPMLPCVIYIREEEVETSAEGGEVCTVYIMRINICTFMP